MSTLGWTPILSAMFLSSLGGQILNVFVVRYPGMAAYQPLINGVAGNLASVLASRLSTNVHKGIVSEANEQITKYVLLGLVVPGHLVFNATLALLQAC